MKNEISALDQAYGQRLRTWDWLRIGYMITGQMARGMPRADPPIFANFTNLVLVRGLMHKLLLNTKPQWREESKERSEKSSNAGQKCVLGAIHAVLSFSSCLGVFVLSV